LRDILREYPTTLSTRLSVHVNPDEHVHENVVVVDDSTSATGVAPTAQRDLMDFASNFGFFGSGLSAYGKRAELDSSFSGMPSNTNTEAFDLNAMIKHELSSEPPERSGIPDASHDDAETSWAARQALALEQSVILLERSAKADERTALATEAQTTVAGEQLRLRFEEVELK
jgi:hypothetical protein